MNFWNQVPLLRLLIPLIIGISTAFLFNDPFDVHEVIPCILFILISFWIIYYKRIIRNYSNRWLIGVALNILLAFYAFQLTNLKTSKFKANHFSHYTQKKSFVVAEVDEAVVEKENTFRLIVDVSMVKDSLEWKQSSGKAIVYLQKSKEASAINYGDRLLLYGAFINLESPANPGEFDYKHYLSNRSIYQRAYITTGEWKSIGSDKGNPIVAFAIQLRDKFLNVFSSHGVSGKEYAVAAALILGNTDKLDADLLKEYSGVGVMHILSVSGMHVGVLFLMMNFLLQFLDKFKYGKIIKSILLLLIIWLYALITGLSPAVLRASTMFTFVIVGKTLNRNVNIYNSLGSSAFFLLLWNPYFLTDLGFQLSYLAVLGIVAIQPYISDLWVPRNWILKQIWSLTAVSIAAQLATFPLSIYYFHQFPNYFIFSNLIIIPLSNFVIYSGVLVLLSFPFGWLSDILSLVMAWLIKSMNSIIHFIEYLPFAVTKNISVSNFEMIMLYIFFITLIYFLVTKKTKVLKYVLVVSIAIEISFCFDKFITLNQNKFVVYNIKKATAIDFIKGDGNTLIASEEILNDEGKIKMYIQGNWIDLGIRNTFKYSFSKANENKIIHPNYLMKQNQFIQFNNKRIVVIDDNNCYESSTKKVILDYIILTHNANIKISEITQQYKSNLIIMDASNSTWRVKKWSEECEKSRIKYYNIIGDKAFVCDL